MLHLSSGLSLPDSIRRPLDPARGAAPGAPPAELWIHDDGGFTLAKAMDNAPAFGGATLDSSALAQNWLDLDAEYATVGVRSASSRDGVGRIYERRRHCRRDTARRPERAAVEGLDIYREPEHRQRASAHAGYLRAGRGTGIIGLLRPDMGYVLVPDDPAKGAYANPAAFAAPAPGQWGNALRNAITGPATFSLNASVARTFRLGNRLNLDWRVDVTNVLAQSRDLREA